MRTLRRSVATPALLLVAALAAAAPGGGSSFEKRLDEAQTFLGNERWRQAKDALLAALDEAEGRPDALHRLAEIEDDLALCSFFLAHPKPAPRDVVAGELISYRQSGHLRLRYGGGGFPPGDFERSGDFWIFPGSLEGDHTVRLGLELAAGTRIELLRQDAEGDGYAVALVPQAVGLYRTEGGDATSLAEAPWSPAAGERNVEIRLSRGQLSVSLDGRSIAQAGLDADARGSGVLALSNLNSLASLELEGQVEPSWVESRIDQEVEARRLAFEEGYDVDDDLPRWVVDAKGDMRARAGEADPFAGLGSAHRPALARAKQHDAAGAYAEGLIYAKSLPEDGDGEVAREWLHAYFLHALERYGDALPHAERTVELARGFLPGRLVRNEAYQHTRSADAATKDARDVARSFPDEAEAHELLAELLFIQGDLEGSEAAVRTAMDRGLYSDQLESLDHVLARARRGPAWSRSFEYASRNYIVRSDISRELCRDATVVLEQANLKFTRQLGRLPSRHSGKAVVYIFSGQLGYLRYSSGLLGGLPMHTAGVYSPGLRQVLAWNLPERDDLMHTLQHEALHQFLDGRLADPPVWLHEGLAEYFELAELVRGNWNDGAVHPGHTGILDTYGDALPTLAELMSMDAGRFYGNPGRNYAHAWAAVHFFHHGPVRVRRLYQDLFDRLARGSAFRTALEEVLPAAERAGLEGDFRAHVASLSPSAR